jgi:cell division septation protein DedD
MIVASRWAGRLAVPEGAGRGSSASAARAPGAGPPTEAGVPIPATPDLTFYQTLGGSRPSSGARNLPRDAAAPNGARGGGEPAGGAYVVQALATRDGTLARRLRDRLRARGLPAVLSEERVAAGVVYRVRVGRYRDRPVAELVARRLRERDGLNPWVLREAG